MGIRSQDYRSTVVQYVQSRCEVSVRGDFSEPVAPNLEAFHRPREQHRHPAVLGRSDRARQSAPPGPLDDVTHRHQPRHRLTPCQDPNRSKPPEDEPGSSNLLFSRATSANASPRTNKTSRDKTGVDPFDRQYATKEGARTWRSSRNAFDQLRALGTWRQGIFAKTVTPLLLCYDRA